MEKIYATNRKSIFEYEVLEKFEAGMELRGFEVKAVKSGKINLTGSYVIIKKNEAFLINALIPPFQSKNAPSNYDPMRTRKLLLTKKELKYLSGKSNERGLTLLPIRCYDRRNLLKLEFAVARRKKKRDKREAIKKRDVRKNINRALKN